MKLYNQISILLMISCLLGCETTPVYYSSLDSNSSLNSMLADLNRCQAHINDISSGCQGTMLNACMENIYGWKKVELETYSRNTFLVPPEIKTSSCYSDDAAIASLKKLSEEINIGDSKTLVLAKIGLLPYMVLNERRRQTESFLKEGKLTEIYYFRSQWISDSRITDDEYQPFIFEDGKLVGKGWSMLGGPKTLGSAPSRQSSSSQGQATQNRNQSNPATIPKPIPTNYLIRTEPVIGAVLCHYSDGTSRRIGGGMVCPYRN